MSDAPRIAPGTAAQIGRFNALIAGVLGHAAGSGPPNIFTTLARHRRLFVPWLIFAGRLMPGGRLPRPDTELLILRVAHNCGCEYERRQHERIGPTAGLTTVQIEAIRTGASEAFDDRQQLLLRAADELHAERDISDELWAALSARLTDVELIELCMLVGHYEMLAMTLNSLRVQPDAFGSATPSRIMRLVARR
jgi:alkylhydroperoxidase family enzyme